MGQTYTEGNDYYSLFGDIVNLNTWQGKLFQKLDEMFIKNFEYRATMAKVRNQLLFEDPFEKFTDFNIGFNFSRDFWGLAGVNVYLFNSQESKAYYFIYEDLKAMRGKFDFGDNKLVTKKARYPINTLPYIFII